MLIESKRFPFGITAELRYDPEPSSPREWDNLGLLVILHRRYDLGDKVVISQNLSAEEALAELKDEHEPRIILPVYLMDHSGLSLSTGAFSCPWDSGQVGWIMDTAENRKAMEIDDEYPDEKITEWLEGEVETYSQYVQGLVYGYVVEAGDAEDSCWGFYSEEDAWHEAQGAVDYWTRKGSTSLATIKALNPGIDLSRVTDEHRYIIVERKQGNRAPDELTGVGYATLPTLPASDSIVAAYDLLGEWMQLEIVRSVTFAPTDGTDERQ